MENRSRGFTLIELIIAIGIFSIFLIVYAGVFSRFIETQRHGIAQGALILDVQSAMEAFIKEARTAYGSTYDVTQDGKQVMFRNQSTACVSYRVTRAGIFERGEAVSDPNGACPIDKFNGVLFAPITSTSTIISDVLFDITPSDFDSNTLVLGNQGVITLTMTVAPINSGVLPISIQNTVTSRQILAYDE
ncbi:MAG TPA: prepilin-type N-terminal cleavage/methylation domain-containing protein [Candidatus Andersenbacteria bacterium]|nr:prepilin-type N-terminal cleavage/methylation domain-containing protein [Candidatus Andersenbacteria bacterium]